MNKSLLKLKKQLSDFQKKKDLSDIKIEFTDVEVYELFKRYSQNTKDDIQANYKDNLLNYSDLKEETKKEIFEIYANIINYGNGYTGIKEASKGYFGEESDDLNLQQATMLAGLPQSPKRYNPTKYYDKAVARQKDVIEAMQKYGDIDYNEDYYILADRDFNLV